MSHKSNGTYDVDAAGLCEDPDYLQPFYLVSVTSGLKMLLTAMVFKIDRLKPPQQLSEEWRADDAWSRLKRVGGLFMQIVFIALALNAFIADSRDVAIIVHNHSLWQKYTCFIIRWNTGTNIAPALASFVCGVGLLEVLFGIAKHMDPRPFGRLHKVAFCLKCAYCFGLVGLVFIPAAIGWVSHAIVGCLAVFGIAVYEILKFILFAFWRDLFSLNGNLFVEDVDLLWTFSYPALLILGGYHLVVPVLVRVILWWHGMRPGLADAVEYERLEEVADEDLQVPIEGPMTPPQDSVMTTKIRRLKVSMLASLVATVSFPMSTLIAARICQGDGVYTAIEKIVCERTFRKYATHMWANLLAAGASMQHQLYVVLHTMWALL